MSANTLAAALRRSPASGLRGHVAAEETAEQAAEVAPPARPGRRAGAADLGLAPARTLPERRDGVRLLAIDAHLGSFREHTMADLPALLAPGDLLVVNDAATLPASLRGYDEAGRALEARLVGKVDAPVRPDPTPVPEGVRAAPDVTAFRAVLFGAGDWRTRTEDRPPPPPLALGAGLFFGSTRATVVERSPLSPRLVTLVFEGAAPQLMAALYDHGRPVQYAHLDDDLPLWAVQNVYASRPEAFEMPSAGRALSWDILLQLRSKNVRLAALTHAAGLSATGDPDLDRALPLPERYHLPARTVELLQETRREGGRVVAVGTTVVRALEGAALLPGGLRPGDGETDLRIRAGFLPRLVGGVLSGVHGPGETHYDLLHAFAPAPLLQAACEYAAQAGFLTHELGDATLILGDRESRNDEGWAMASADSL